MESKESTFYHQIGWKNVVTTTYGHKPIYLIARDKDRIVGILPMFLIRNPFLKSSLVSLPFAPYGGICADNPQIGLNLFDAMIEMQKKLRIKYAEIRSINCLPVMGVPDKSYYSLVLPIQSDIEIQWKKLRKTMRQLVTKAKSQKIDVSLNSNNPQIFYDVYSRSMHNFGAPAHSEIFFKNIFREFPNSTRVAEAYHHHECIGTIFLLEFKDTIISGWGASDIHFTQFHHNYLLYWEVIHDACKRNFSAFDFGRSIKDEGTYIFKTGWGAEPFQIYYHYFPARIFDTKKINPNRQIFAEIWKHLPLVVSKHLGPIIRRNIP
jgi:FemAB-related protein (PEP-CTERM system-associated)